MFSITDIGRKRKLNQDYVFTSDSSIGTLPNLFVVADGMGGHNAGDFASKYTVETICSVIKKSKKKDSFLILKEAIEAANEHVRMIASEDEKLMGMGTTVVAATCTNMCLQVANVGDSRLYVVNKDIKQITRDHSLVEEMVRLGGIDKEDAKHHPDKNIITRAIGATETIEIDFFTVDLEQDDLILMCSDGLTNMLDDCEIQEILSSQYILEKKAQELVKAANTKGGKDNIAVILIKPSREAVENGDK